ncbi:MAG: class I SAM-dependent methyltransferase [Elusimicrobia bacterium]|nr:class I SAM-dependent methyltransferase [Elusimicrobiota bacterium]MDE2425965.1 class I SAM-dependent methyltransferase [Elusimicrobiota bacterium]
MRDDRGKDKGGVLAEHGSWEAVYRDLKPEELPWNAGGPDPELVSLVDSGAIPVGRAIDIGAGPGHDAIFLAKRGFRVLALDIAASAIELAKANAKKARVGVAIDFRVEDVLKLSSPPGSATFVNDRGCFHVLPEHQRRDYLRRIGDVLVRGGQLLLRTFSEKEPPGPGPHRFTGEQLERIFFPRFDFLRMKEGLFEGPRKPKALVCLLRKK